MNSYYALIYLNAELNAKLEGYLFVKAVSSRKNVLDLFFEKGGDELKLTVSLTHGSTAIFTDPRVSHRSANVAMFFTELSGKEVAATMLADGDRILTIKFMDGSKLIIKPYGTKGNVLYVKDGTVMETFKDAANQVGAPEPVPQAPSTVPFGETKGDLRKRIFKTWPFLQRHIVADIIKHRGLDKVDDFEIEAVLNEVDSGTRNNAEFRLLSDGHFCIVPARLLPLENEKTFDSIDEAIRMAYYRQQSQGNFQSQKQAMERMLTKEAGRLERLVLASKEAPKSLERAAQYEQFGNLLMAFSHLDAGKSDTITLENFYDEGRPVAIPINPEMNLAANAAHYFGKKKKAERSHSIQLEQGERAGMKLESINKLMEALEGCKDIKSLKMLSGMLAEEGFAVQPGKQQATEARPFLVANIGSHEIWIGKNAKSNDALVREAHKDDVWLHAKGVSGSHVLIRMNKRTQAPDKSCLELAASWAAWKSKAKGSKLVPVIWTRRKFIRKPKGAPPGTVLVEKENVILAEPIEPEFDYIGL